jgi:hypothetical protein
MMVTPNKRMQLTKRGHLVGGSASRAVVIESRFAADPRCYVAGIWPHVNASDGRVR